MIEVNNPCTEEQNVPAVNYRKLVLLAGFASVATAISLILMKAAVWFFQRIFNHLSLSYRLAY